MSTDLDNPLLKAHPDSRLLSRLKSCSRSASCVVFLFGCLGLAGWTFEIDPLKNVFHGLPHMVPNTAMAFVLAGLSLWLQRTEAAGTPTRRTAKAFAFAVALLGALTLSEYLWDWDPGIDRLLFGETLSKLPPPIPGRPAFLTALNFLLLGLALLLLDLKSRYHRRPVELLTATAILISLLALIGYACNVPFFYTWITLFPNTGTALHTAVAFTVLGVGILCVRPDQGLMGIVTSPTASGTMARRLILAPVLIPLMTGLLKAVGLRTGMYNVELVSWLFAFLNIFIFTLAIWWSASLLHRAEIVRSGAEADLQEANAELEERVSERTAELSRAVTTLQESEERVRLVLDTALDAVITIDGRGVVTSWNRQAEQTFGWSRQEILGQSLSGTIIPPRYREAHERGLKHFLATQEGPVLNKRIEISALHREGREFPVELAITPIRLGGSVVFSAFVRDITERKRAEQLLATHHAITQSLAESTTLGEIAKKILQFICQKLQWDVGGLWTVDRTTRRLRCVEIWHPPSTEFQAFVNVSRQMSLVVGEGLPGRVCESGQPVWIADVSQESNLPRKDVATRIGLRSAIAFPIKLREETLGVIEFFSAQIRKPDGELLTMFSLAGSQIGQFIERKQIEEQYHQSQKMEAFGQLAGGVAHDFNNILAVILGYAGLIIEQDGLNVELKEQMREIYSAGERAANLTRQLLTFSRKKQMEISPLDLNEVIGNITKMLGRIIGEAIKLQCNYGSNLPTIQADEGMMEQVVMNLAVNARDAMPNGGRLTIGTEAADTDAAYVQRNPDARTGEFICLSLQDTGCGMTPEIKARIFEPFFTTKGVGKGTGLGLATVYGIVKQHQGWLEVESQVGVGTTFKVFLPASPRLESVSARTSADDKVRGGHETILLVEDDMALRGMAKIILQRHGYRVLEAGTGVEALAVWEEHQGQINLLVTDMVMPEGLTGRELAKRLQARKPDLKVVYCSGYSLDSEWTTFRLREAPTFLQKPYHPQKLAQAVREVLDGKTS